MVLRENTPGLPDYFTGKKAVDPLPITVFTVNDNLVGWMTAYQLAKSMHIVHSGAILILEDFLNKNGYASRRNNGVWEYSKFSGHSVTVGQ